MYITLRPVEAASIPGLVSYGASRTARSHRDLVDLHYFFTGPRDSALALSAAAMLRPRVPRPPDFAVGYGVGGSSHGAFINPLRMERLFRELTGGLNLCDAFVAIHFGPFGRVDFHLIFLNLDRSLRQRFPGIFTAEREIRHQLRDLTSELNRERLDAGEFSVGNRRKKGGHFFFIESEEISPALPPPAPPEAAPLPSDPAPPPSSAPVTPFAIPENPSAPILPAPLSSSIAAPPTSSAPQLSEPAPPPAPPDAAPLPPEPASPASPAPVNTTANPENPSVPPAPVGTLLAPPIIPTPAASAPAPAEPTPPPAPRAAPAPIPPLPPAPLLASPAPQTATPAPVARSLPLTARSPAGPAPSSSTAATNQAPRTALPTEIALRPLPHRSAQGEEAALARKKKEAEEAEKAETLLRQRHRKMREQIALWIKLAQAAERDRNQAPKLAREAENYPQALMVLLFQQAPACNANEAQAFLKRYARSHHEASEAIDDFFHWMNVIRCLPGPDNDPPPPQKIAKDPALW